MVNMLRLIKGYISFEASRGFPERFINLCKIKGADLWNVENKSDVICGYTSLKHFSLVEDAADSSGMELKTVEKCGLPFFAERHKWRCGVALGLACMCAFIWFMSGFIWQVELRGEPFAQEAELQADLKTLGVYSGARKSRVDILAVQEELLCKHPKLNWISVNVFGGKALVEYTLTKDELPIRDTSEPVNVISLKKGKITLVEVYTGSATVKEGDYVSAGDLLISGVVGNADGSEKITHATGKVFAYTENTCESTVCKERELLITGDEKSVYAINFFGLHIPLGKRREDAVATYIYAQGNGAVLPVGIIRYDYPGLTDKKVTLTDSRAFLTGLCESVGLKRSYYKEADIKFNEYSYLSDTDTLTILQEICCIENIAREQGFYVEEN